MPLFDSLIQPALKSVTDLIEQFHLSPEDKLKAEQAIREAQAKAEQSSRDYEVQLASLKVQDTSSARNMQMSVKDWTPKLLSIFVTGGFFGLLTLTIFRDVPAGTKDIVNIMTGSLGTAWITIIGYYFGSSAGSDRKTDLMGATQGRK